jgi:hypothetical protein
MQSGISANRLQLRFFALYPPLCRAANSRFYVWFTVAWRHSDVKCGHIVVRFPRLPRGHDVNELIISAVEFFQLAKKRTSMSGKSKSPPTGRLRSPVARHAHKVNRAIVFHDRTRYKRKAKHKNLEPFPMAVISVVRVSGRASEPPSKGHAMPG